MSDFIELSIVELKLAGSDEFCYQVVNDQTSLEEFF